MVTFAVLNLYNIHNSGNIACFKLHAACDLNFIVVGEGLLKVTSGHVHWKSGNISEVVC